MDTQGSMKENCPRGLPPLIRSIEESPVDAFAITSSNDSNDQYHAPQLQVIQNGILHHPRRHTQSVPITLPVASTLEVRQQSSKKVLFSDDVELVFEDDNPSARGVRFNSQPIPIGVGYDEAVASGKFPNIPVRSSRSYNKLKDGRYNSFKTWTSKQERQASMKIRGQTDSPENGSHPQEVETPPVHRYFDALRGPELDTLKPSEEILLPKDRRWPFLLRYPISSFGICLGISSQAILWKTLASTAATHFLHISLKVNLILWFISVALWLTVSTTYLLKVFFYFEAVRREYYHPIRVNFFFAPWIALLFLALGVPPRVAKDLPHVLWYILMSPIFCLELKIYGQWMSGGQRRLSKVANPSNHLSVVGNFVGALLGASMGLKEGPLFFFSIGVAHYMVLFVTLYQRLPTNETLPKELHPVFFLFVAAPSVASMAWAKIHGSFDNGARIPYFIALFLYFSLAVRLNFFRGFKFSLAWWAYTFPMTGAAIATIRYSNEVPNIFTKILAVALSSTATITVTGLLVTTFLHAFVFRDLFPNDIAIAISDHKPKPRSKWYHHNDDNHIEHYFKFASPDNKDVQVAFSSSPEIKDAQTQRLSPVQENQPPRP